MLEKITRPRWRPASSQAEHHLLLIEDDALSARQMSRMIHDAANDQPIGLTHVSHMAEAESQLRANPEIDLVILKLGLSGSHYELEAIDQIRAVRSDLPIVAISKKQFDPVGMTAILRGATTFLQKDSINKLVLIETVQRLLLQSEQQNLRRLIEFSSEGILVLNSQREVLFANQAAGELLDLDVDRPEDYQWRFPLTSHRFTIKVRPNVFADISISNAIWKGQAALMVYLRESI